MTGVELTIGELQALSAVHAGPFDGDVPTVGPSPAVFSRLGLEARLGAPGRDDVELTAQIALDAAGAPERWVEHSWWERAGALPARDLLGRSGHAQLRDVVRALYLELDRTRSGDTTTSIFVTLDETRSMQLDDIRAIHRVVAASAPHARCPVALGRVLEALTADAPIYHVGWMLGRAANDVRLCAIGGRDVLFRAVHALGISGLDAFRREVDTLAGDECTPSLQIAIDESGLVRVGIEIAPHEALVDDVDFAWSRVLGRVERAGLCSVADRARLEQWAGAHVVSTPGSRIAFECVRAISHLKLAPAPSGVEYCKAYATVTPRLRSAA